jgi:hypothetical protein
MSFVRISKEIKSLRQANLLLITNVVIHEFCIDLDRLDQNSPAHRMYFSKKDIAHQALVAVVSISVSLTLHQGVSGICFATKTAPA